MRNLKKLLAVVVAICMLATLFTIPAFAATKTDAQICADLGVLKGDTTEGVTEAYLAKGTSRMQAAIMLLRLMGKEDVAYATEETENWDDASETWDKAVKALAYLKANPDLGWQGVSTTKFDPNGKATAQMIYKVMLEALGYKQDVDFIWADVYTFADGKGLSAIADVNELTNDDMATAVVEALKANVKDGSKTLAADLVAKGVITEEAAIEAGLVPAAVALDVSSAVALNSKVIEVTLGTAAASKDLTGVAVKDSADKDIAVSKIEFAPWSTNGKSVLVTLVADTAVGTFYTLTAGTKSVNFGGRAVDTAKPAVAAVTVVDYNEINIDFNEAVLLDGTVDIAMLYNEKTALANLGVSYVDKDTIKVMTGDQSAATLYGVTIKGFSDLMGLKMDNSTDKTFVGIPKSTAKNTINTITPIDSKTIDIKFNVMIDGTTTLDASKYTLKEQYGDAVITVASVGVSGTTKDTVRVVLATDTKAATLYEIKVAAGITTKYGVATTDALSGTFVGEAKDETKIGAIAVAPISNTKIEVTAGSNAVKDAFDANTALEMFSIKEEYGTATLAISAIKIDKNVATLTVAPQSAVLYKVTMAKGVKDAAGNATTDDLTATFVGKAVAAKISAISLITRVDDNTIVVKFNQNVGSNVADVSRYSIDGSVGYPQKAETTANADEVKLTIPKTRPGTLYTLTVKGLLNADGVAMDTAGVSAQFSGQGLTATNPKVEGIVALDAQTLKIYFDRAADDASIKGAGKLWNGTALVTGAFLYNDAGSATQDLEAMNEYVYKDPSNANAIIVRVDDTVAFNSSNFEAGKTMFTLTVDTAKVVNTVGLPFANNNTAPTNPAVAGVVANNINTVTVYFSESVSGVSYTDFEITANADGSGASIAVSAFTKVDDKTYQLKTADMAAQAYYLRIVDTAASDANKTIDKITDISGYVELKSTFDSTSARDYAAYQFAGSTTAVGTIKSIPVVMTNARTMVVYYPEAMNTSTGPQGVKNKTNYTIENAGGTALITSATEIAEITWNAANNTATLVFNTDVDDSTTGYFVKFAQTIENELGTKTVVNGTNDVKSQFAKSTVEAPKVAIASVSYAAGVITVKLSQSATTAADVDDTTKLLAQLKVVAKNAGADDAIGTADITSFTFKLDSATVSPTTGLFNTIVITLNGGQIAQMTPGQVATVSINSTNTLTGINGMAANADSKAVFIQ